MGKGIELLFSVAVRIVLSELQVDSLWTKERERERTNEMKREWKKESDDYCIVMLSLIGGSLLLCRAIRGQLMT